LSDEDTAGGPESPEQGKVEGSPDSERSDVAPAEPGSLADALDVPGSDAAEAFHRRARLAEDRLAEVLNAYRTLRTENEGYRERITKNLDRRYDQRRERLLLKFIDILDNLDRALEAAEQSYAGEPLIEGLILVRTQLLQTLQDEGLERIPVIGLPYDPNFSEAVEMRQVEDPDHHNLVVKELLRGYRLNGRIARASRVAVGQYQGEPAEAPAEPPARESLGESQTAPPPPSPAVSHVEGEPSLDDIISRAEAQEALFPDAFEEDSRPAPKK
jgi:molecular chaperone GrpE